MNWLEQSFRPMFLRVAAAILFLTAAAKLISVMGEARILAQADPLFSFLSNRQLLALAAGLEISVGIALLMRRFDPVQKTGLVAWLATVFAGYRAGLWSIGHKGSCSCLGNAAAWLGVSTATLDRVMLGVLGFLLIGSCGLLLRHWLRVRASAPGDTGQIGETAQITD